MTPTQLFLIDIPEGGEVVDLAEVEVRAYRRSRPIARTRDIATIGAPATSVIAAEYVAPTSAEQREEISAALERIPTGIGTAFEIADRVREVRHAWQHDTLRATVHRAGKQGDWLRYVDSLGVAPSGRPAQRYALVQDEPAR